MDQIRSDEPPNVPAMPTVEAVKDKEITVKAVRPPRRLPFLFLGLLLGLVLGGGCGTGVTLLVGQLWTGPDQTLVRNTAEAFLHSAVENRRSEAAQLCTETYRRNLANDPSPLMPQAPGLVLKHFTINSCDVVRGEAWVKGTLSAGRQYASSGSFIVHLVKEHDGRWRVDSFSASSPSGG